MQGFVRTKVIKLLDPQIIYPICDSTWLSFSYHQTLEKIVGYHFYHLDGCSKYFQIDITLKD